MSTLKKKGKINEINKNNLPIKKFNKKKQFKKNVNKKKQIIPKSIYKLNTFTENEEKIKIEEDNENNNENHNENKLREEKSEKEKMISGELYEFSDEELSEDRTKCKEIIKEFNDSYPRDLDKRRRIYKKLFKKFGEKSYIEPPFYCDYGYNISIGDRTIFNYDNVILDCTKVTIGNDCLFSPGCQIITVTHPIDYKGRKTFEYTKPVTIGNNCFFGAGCIILPGVTIGDRVVIGAGCVVSTDIESDSIVAEDPSKYIIKKIQVDN